MNRKTNTGSGINVGQWLGWADEDYLSARALLLNGFLLQGAVLTNTAIEKYLKSALIARGKSFNKIHLVEVLYDELGKSGKVPVLNRGFLRTLTKAYKLRYPDELANGFNIHLVGTKLLTEVDQSVFELRTPFHLKRPDGAEVITKFENFLRMKLPLLMERNSALGAIDRGTLFQQHSPCYDLRVVNGAILEASYVTERVKDDGCFDVEGLKPGKSDREFSLGALPIQQKQ